MSTATESARAPGADAEGLRLTPVVLLGAAPQPDLTLTIDRRGVVLSGAATGERALPWHRVTGWQVDPWEPRPGMTGAVVTYRTLRATYRFGVPGADAGALGHLVEQLGQEYLAMRTGVSSATAPEAPAPSGMEERVRRLRPVLVVVLIAVLAIMVTLILLQSAGVIDLPLIGGNGSNGSGAVAAQSARHLA